MNREFFELVLVLFPRPRFEETEDDYEGRGGGRESWELPGSCSLGSSEWNGSLPMNLVLPTRRADFSPLRPRTVDLSQSHTPTLKRDKSRVPSLTHGYGPYALAPTLNLPRSFPIRRPRR